MLFVVVGCATADGASDVEDVEDVQDLESAVTAGCPTAPKRDVTWWRWAMVEDVETLAWSPDGTEILVSEHVFEMKSALIGYDQTRRHCHRLAVYAPDGTRKREMMPLTTGYVPYFPGSITFMPTYAVIHVQNYAQDPVGLWEAIRVAPNGQRKTLVAWPKCQHGLVIPSPDGTKMAVLSIVSSCTSGPQTSTSTVSFRDAAGNPTGGTATLPFTTWPVGTWTPAGTFIATDRTTAVRVAVTGTTTPVAVPQCTEPGTTSSEVAFDGRLVGFVNGKLNVFGVDTSRAFGCQ
jgi:hypothetical protein